MNLPLLNTNLFNHSELENRQLSKMWQIVKHLVFATQTLRFVCFDNIAWRPNLPSWFMIKNDCWFFRTGNLGYFLFLIADWSKSAVKKLKLQVSVQ